MQFKVKRNIENLMQSEIRNMSLECETRNGINLSQGMCDLPLDDILKNGLFEAIEKGENHYTRYDGSQILREAIEKKAFSYNGILCDSNKNIVVSCGATGALYCACYALFSAGDEVILFEPYYGYHEYTLKSLNIIPKYVKLNDGDWEIDFDLLSNAVSKKTRAILISNPCNPCGKVFNEYELLQIADICEKHDLILISDEIYEYIVFDNKKHISPGSIEKLKNRTITISGYSKTFSITGWRVGYLIAVEEISKVIGIVNDLIYVCAPSMAQYSVASAIQKLDMNFYLSLKKIYEDNRNMLCKCLQDIGINPYIPDGAYYVLANVSGIPGRNSKEKAMKLLTETGIATVPGESFYHDGTGKNLVRFCFAKDKKIIEEACNILYDRYFFRH